MDDGQALKNWNAYQAAWADISTEERRAMVTASISPVVVYTDPTSVSHGYDELTAKMVQTQQRFPGATFSQRQVRLPSRAGHLALDDV